MHSFNAFIDESGDEGFVFKDPPERASSEWFVISALLLRTNAMPKLGREVSDFLKTLAQGSPPHFAKLQHEARVALVAKIATLPVRVVSVCINKKAIANQAALNGNRRLYFYATRFLIERISWICRDEARTGEGNGTCKLTFSRCKNLSYAEMQLYFGRLRSMKTEVAWNSIDTGNITVLQHANSVWLQLADGVASGVAKSLELDRFGFCEDRFVCALKPVTYCRPSWGRKAYLPYGLKFFPTVPEPEKNKASRYAWLASFRQ